jgi:hypothetical protein
MPTGKPCCIEQQGFFVWGGGQRMKENQGAPWIKARLKTHREVIWVFPRAVYWGRPNHGDFRQADECILPFLGKEVWVRKMRGCRTDFYFEIKDTGGLIVLPNWIDHFESEDLIPPAEWKDPDCEWADDTWIDHFEDRFFVVGDTVIIHG